MNSAISKTDLGNRVRRLRKIKGYSQEELASIIGISRPSLAQIEVGKRSLEAVELKNISMALGLSLDEFMSEKFDLEGADMLQKSKAESIEERISIPVLQVNKFKNILLYLLEKCAGKPNVGETVLNKLLYFCDFNYYETYEEHLTGAVYKKLPFGPVPHKLDQILDQMIQSEQIKRIKTNYHNFKQTRYLPLEKPDLSELKASEKEIIDRVIEQMSNWSAGTISSYSHKDMPWLATREGDIINYELAFYRDAPYSVRSYDDEIEL
jgi:transcriptional regulator with XRE-family HTH domain